MCLQNLLRRKSRTLLTVLGVLIGCCSIVIMVSLGIGMKESQEKLLSEMGDLTIITVTAPQGGRGKIKLDDKLPGRLRRLSGVEAVTPKQRLEVDSIRILAGIGNRYIAEWTSVGALDTGEMEHIGYQLTQGAAPKKAGEVTVGQYLAYSFRDTFRPEGMDTVDRWSGSWDENGNQTNVPDPFFDPMRVPLTLEIESEAGKFTVPVTPVGVTKEDYSKGSETSDGILMSLSDLRKILDKTQGNKRKAVPYDSILVKVSDLSQVESVESEIKAMGYATESMESIRKPMEKEARQKQLMLGGLGAISLFVAALGITNTMIMSISERTREIGIMKALGCYVHDIRAVFLAEAGAIGLIGGMVGCLLSFLISVAINVVSMGGFSPDTVLAAITGAGGVTRVSVIPPWLFGFAIVFSVLIGLGSGFYPANQAVKIPALEAIKSE